MATKPIPIPTYHRVLHEIDYAQGRHRIIYTGTNCSAGQWFALSRIARHLDFRANLEEECGLPVGVFNVTAVGYETLEGK